MYNTINTETARKLIEIAKERPETNSALNNIVFTRTQPNIL